MKQFSHTNLTGEASMAWGKRPNMKLDHTKASLAVCIPVGNKQCNTAFTDGNGLKWLSPGHAAPSLVPVPFLMATMQLAMPLNTSTLWFTKHGIYSGEARQAMTSVALPQLHDHEHAYILYWDDDTIPEDPLALYIMHQTMEENPDIGILSGYYCSRNDPPSPVVFRPHGQGCDWEIKVGPQTGPQDAWAMGAGFMLARASAVKKAMELNPGEPIWADMKSMQVKGEEYDETWGHAVNWGHDVRFCELIRQAGYRVMIDGRVECGHWDRNKSKMYKLPPDAAPRRLGRDLNGAAYWDQLYTAEDARLSRRNTELMHRVSSLIEPNSSVVEVGCGTGMFGQYITAKNACRWYGFDQSKVGIGLCQGRFLEATQADIMSLKDEVFAHCDYIVALEVVEHLQPEEIAHLISLVVESKNPLIFSVPNNKWGPDEVPEHTDLFNKDKVEEIFGPYCEKHGYSLHTVEGDDDRLIVVFGPKEE